MKLTKSQRHTAYILLLFELQTNSTYRGFVTGLCWVWNNLNNRICHSKLPIILPELFDKRRRYCSSYWFHTKKERIGALKQCIEETY